MSPRPPPKISLKHEWKIELGSEHAQLSEVGQLSRSFQSNQPILNPIRERTERPVIRYDARTVQDERKTSRSQEIDVNSFHEELVSSERKERPGIETSVIQAGSSEDSKDPNVETNTENVPDSSQTRSVHESETFNVGDKTFRERTERPVIDHDDISPRWTWTSDFQDYHILLWSMRRVPAFENWCRNLRTTQIDTLFNKIHDKIKHITNLVQNQRMIQDVGNIELFELLETEPKTQYTACLSYWNVGIVYCTCGQCGQSKIRLIFDGPSFTPRVCHQEGKTSWPQIW